MSLKYHNNAKFRVQNNTQASRRTLNKYHNNTTVRSKIKTRSKIDMLHKYHANSDFRNQYKAHATIQSHQCILKHGNLYIQNIKEFRKIIQNGPDYVCISCGLALFRNQVIPFIKEKYIKEKQQLPSRVLLSKLEVSEIPSELKRLNNLEKHLVALRLPFMKIVNLTSGKIPSRLSQKKPVNKSMMVRLQLKRRLKYKAIWEEQLINPHVKDALLILKQLHPGYNNIQINEIDESYPTSDKDNNVENNTNSLIETMSVDTFEKENSIEEIAISNENHLKSLALGDIGNNNSDEEIAWSSARTRIGRWNPNTSIFCDCALCST
ncbi:unnamed protein product [Rotaria socialis]|uniref:DUF6570 domain-containing protein n=1 Tax=Rotaria socialis TaxID=392032 RepID=A0A820NS83_9BILA|nr:unnamed protein product [Rotaria socialis]